MIYDNDHFTSNIKWNYSQASYILNDFQNSASHLQLANYTYTGSLVQLDAALVRKAFDVLLKDVNFTANPYVANPNLPWLTPNIRIVGANDLKSSTGVSVDGVKLGSVSDGVVTVAINLSKSGDFDEGEAKFHTLLHELAHALGVGTIGDRKHPNQFDNSYTFDNTIMSYINGKVVIGAFGVANPATPMMYDVAVLQHLYGAKTAPTADVNTYTLTNANKGWTIWDAGGKDVLDASALPSNVMVTLDLRGGADDKNVPYFSMTGSSRAAKEAGDHYGKIKSPTEALAIAYQNIHENSDSAPVRIEEARGGAGNDALHAYQDLMPYEEGSKLIGNAGNDTLVGGAGVNTLEGGEGTDFFYVDENDVTDAGPGENVISIYKGLGQKGADIHDNNSFATIKKGVGADHIGVFGRTKTELTVEDRLYLNNLEVSGGIKPKEFDTPIAINGFKGHLFAVLGGDINNENGATLAVKHLWDNDAVANDNNISFQILRKAA